MKLYDYLPSGNGYKIRLILAHRGLRYDYIPVEQSATGANPTRPLVLSCQM